MSLNRDKNEVFFFNPQKLLAAVSLGKDLKIQSIQNDEASIVRATCLLFKRQTHEWCMLIMLATLIVRCPLFSLCGGQCSAQTYSCKGGTSLLHRMAWGHESGVTAKQALVGVNKETLKKVYKSCALCIALCESPGSGWQQLMPQFRRWSADTKMSFNFSIWSC